MPRMHKTARLVAWTFAAILVLAALLVASAWWSVRRSLPTLDAQVRLPGLAAALTIERDALGTATVKGGNRLDVARGLGFVHAQDRFFEMDLTRRSAAGELSELFGPVVLERDRKRRLHRMRSMLTARYERMDAGERALLQAYADGVNAGLDQLDARPWQYLLLRTQPRAWEPVDSLLVIAEMFWRLQGDGLDAGFERAVLRGRAGDTLFDWLEPQGGHWDAALDRSEMPARPLPGPALIDLRKAPAAVRGATPAASAAASRPLVHAGSDATALLAALEAPDPHAAFVGSNNWALDSTRTAAHGAIVCDDMHLGLSAPSIWFRAQLEIGSGAGSVRAEGVTLPGLPAIIAGSNGAVAWGFTNAYGQWFDWIAVPRDAAPARTVHVKEHIAVKGSADVDLDIALFDGLPIAVQRDGQAYALRWIADRGDAYNLALDDMLKAPDTRTALSVAQRAGMPHQNILVGERGGFIGWTIAGRLWAGSRAAGFGRFMPAGTPEPAWQAPATYPFFFKPLDGQLWTANARQLDAEGASGAEAMPLANDTPDGGIAEGQSGASIGDGGFDVGARAQQIWKRLSFGLGGFPAHGTMPRDFDEKTLSALQLDDEALFLRPWADRIAAVTVAGGSAARPDVAALLTAWNGRADADQAGYRLVRSVRMRTLDALWLAWTTPLLGEMQADPERRFEWHAMFEYPVEQALDTRPSHLLPRPYPDWDAFLVAQVDATVAEMTRDGTRPLAQATWGEANASHVGNVIARAVPVLSRLLDMPSLPQAGDNNMPHVAAPEFGQSERLVVSPGHEERATLSMPGGQSGHPMSPYYGAGHDAWAAGRATPLLAGPAQHRLILAP